MAGHADDRVHTHHAAHLRRIVVAPQMHAVSTHFEGQGDVVINDQWDVVATTESCQPAGFGKPTLPIAAQVAVLQHPCAALQRQCASREQVVAGPVGDGIKATIG